MTNSTAPINSLAARYALMTAAQHCAESLHETAANAFAHFSDDDLDYFPSAANILNTIAANIEPILIPSTNDPRPFALIDEMNNDADFLLDAATFAPNNLCLFLNPAEYELESISPADILEREMLITEYNNAFANLDPNLDLDELPAEFTTNLDAALMNIRNAFINAHRAEYPNSYNSTDLDTPSTITLDPNPYAR